MKHQLILVDGHSTVGKSTISKKVYEQISHQDDIYWLHEECEKHPIRHGEFKAGDIHTLEGMELNKQVMLQKWEQFGEEIRQSKQICITEGCFLHSVDRYLLNSKWNEEQIKDYFSQIVDILKPLNPLIVFLHRPDMKVSFEKAYEVRGDWWKGLILGVPEPFGYFETHEYSGEDSIYSALQYEQEVMSNIFDHLSCDKVKIDTSDESWESYIRQITESAGYKYQQNEVKPFEIEKYCGSYQLHGGDDIWKISFDAEKNQLFTSLFWPYMPMKYIDNDQFELISFPVILQFDATTDKMQFIVKGNYGWGYNDKVFIKV